jgi:hypothetical protein
MQFRLVIKYLATGISFRQVTKILVATREETGLTKLSGLSDTGVANYARIVCGMSLQHLSTILNHNTTWAFSLANDISTHYGQSYFDNRIRLHCNGIIYNIHALAIPIYESHTGLKMFQLVCEFFDIICPTWRTKLISMGSDGASSMTGKHQGVVTRIEQEVNHQMYRIWCGLHQLDLVMKHAYRDLKDGELLSIMYAITGYLRRQQNLIADMQSTCPKLTTRWVAMGQTCKWLLEKRARLFEHFEEHDSNNAPPSWWWIVIAAISALSEQINIVFIKLQSKDLLISQQKAILENLAVGLSSQLGVDGPHTTVEMAALNIVTTSTFGRWSIKHTNVIEFLNDQGLFVQSSLNHLPADSAESCHYIVNLIGQLIVRLIDGIVEIQCERNSNNAPIDNDCYTIPPVLPHALVHLRGSEFTNIIKKHLQQLTPFWNESKIDLLQIQHRELRNAYQMQPLFAQTLDVCDYNTSFEESWKIVEGRFDVLRDFCGGIATAFPNTATVESDFSNLKWEKDKFRMSLTDLSLEGILQCKQFQLLSSLAKAVK